MKLKNLIEQYGEYDVVMYRNITTNEIVINGSKPKPKSAWDLREGDEYFYIYGITVYQAYWGNSEHYDQLRILAGDVFLTKEEAEKEVERKKIETLLLKHGGRRWFKKAPSENYYIWLRQGGGIVISDTSPVLGTIYFDSREQAEKAVAEIGEARIKQALFKER